MHLNTSRSLALFFFLSLGLIVKSTHGQSSFYQEYPYFPEHYLADIIAWPDGTFNGLNSKSNYSPSIGFKHFAGYTSFLSSGELLSAVSFSEDDLFRPSARAVSDSEWLLTTPKYFANDSWSDPGVDLELHLLSRMADTLMKWSVTLDDYVVYHARSTSTGDGGYMTVAVLGSNGSTVPLGFRTRVWKWDGLANLMWTHDWSWGSSSSSMRPDLYSAQDGNVYVHSMRTSGGANFMHVARFGNAGLEWEDSFAVNSGSRHFAGRDDGFALLANVPDSMLVTHHFELFYYDQNGVLELSSVAPIPPTFSLVIEDVESHPNGETGVLYRGESVVPTPFIYYVLRVNPSGAVISQTGLSGLIGCGCHSIQGLHGGGYIASGAKNLGLFGPYIPCIYKLDANGIIARTTLNGYVYVDENGNSVKDDFESYIPGIQLNFPPSSVPSYSSSVGYYARSFFSLDSVKIQARAPLFFEQSYPDTAVFSFAPDTLDGSILSMDIALQVQEYVEEYEIVLVGADAIPGFEYQSWITCKNRGTVFGDTVMVEYVIPPSTSFVHAIPAPYHVEGDTLRFALQFSSYFEDQQIHVVLSLAPDINLVGDTLWSVAKITLPVTDYIPSNNTATKGHRVRAAYDPNQKTVEPLGQGPGYVAETTEWLTYTIDFQNTGNYHASIVRLVDVLPPHVLPESLEFLASSHEPVALHFENTHTAVWTFDPIMLPDSASDLLGSMGYVTFRIRPVPNLEFGTVVRNQAHIYFDFNPPISTAFTNTIWGIPEVNAVVEGLSSSESPLVIYPNPASEIAYVLNIPEDAVLLNLVSSTGNVVTSRRLSDRQNQEVLSLSDLPNGYYYVIIYTKNSNYKVSGSALLIQR